MTEEPKVPTQAEREQLVEDAKKKARNPRRKPTWLALKFILPPVAPDNPERAKVVRYEEVATGTSINDVKDNLKADAVVGEIIIVPVRRKLSITSAQTTFIKTLKL